MRCGLGLRVFMPLNILLNPYPLDAPLHRATALSSEEQRQFVGTTLVALVLALSPLTAALDAASAPALPDDDDDFDACGLPWAAREQAQVERKECVWLGRAVDQF